MRSHGIHTMRAALMIELALSAKVKARQIEAAQEHAAARARGRELERETAVPAGATDSSGFPSIGGITS